MAAGSERGSNASVTGRGKRVTRAPGRALERLASLLSLSALVVLLGCGAATAHDQTDAKATTTARSASMHTLRVRPSPKGPQAPAGGWSVVYADAFGAPLGPGAGHDNTWFPNNCFSRSNCTGFNRDELEVMNPSAVSQNANGLKLSCTYTAAEQQPGGKHYVCGTLRALSENRRGYRFFRWSPGRGQTLVFETVAKLPQNTGEADPAFWSNGPPWYDTEFDFFEAGGWGSQHTTGWVTDPLYTVWFAHPHLDASKFGFHYNPVSAFHTYTTEISSNNTFSEWIDGVPQPWATNVGPAQPDLSAKGSLVLSYALRACQCQSGFTGGTRHFDVKSVAVYEDTPHRGAGIENAGTVPGTIVG
jgi:hypothetical protein